MATFIALMSHVAGGGAVPQLLGVAVPWTLSLMVCTVLAGRALSLTRLTIAVMISQALFHALFVLGASAGPARETMHVHDHGGMLDAVTSTSIATVGSASGMLADSTMWIAHAVAAVITVAALYRGEPALLRLHELARTVRTWVGRLVSAFDVPRPDHPSRVHASTHRVVFRPLDHSASSQTRRGPPAVPVI